MNCAECKEQLIPYIEKLLDNAQAKLIAQHVKACSACRAELKGLQTLQDRLVSNGKVIAQSDLEDQVMSRIIREQNARLKSATQAGASLRLRRSVMKSPMTKVAAAAVIVGAAVLSVNIWDETIPPAYAFEHTVQAYHTVRFLHIKDFKSGEDEPKEFWLEFDREGQIKNFRVYSPQWDSPSDGAKLSVWQGGEAKIWFKKNNALLATRDERLAQLLLELVRQVDPGLAVERLYERENRGELNINVEVPAAKAEPIMVTATYPPESPSPGRRVVLLVDQATKLVRAMNVYQMKNNEYQHLGLLEFHDYNQDIDPEMFTLDDEVPADVVRVDQTTQEVGLAQGDLSNGEIAVEVARQFVEALIDNDYAKAGILIGGAPADWVKQQPFGKIKVLRIVSIGPASPHSNPKTGGVVVPCVLQIEEDGKVSKWKLDQLGVRPVHNQAGRWHIFSVPDR